MSPSLNSCTNIYDYEKKIFKHGDTCSYLYHADNQLR